MFRHYNPLEYPVSMTAKQTRRRYHGRLDYLCPAVQGICLMPLGQRGEAHQQEQRYSGFALFHACFFCKISKHKVFAPLFVVIFSTTAQAEYQRVTIFLPLCFNICLHIVGLDLHGRQSAEPAERPVNVKEQVSAKTVSVSALNKVVSDDFAALGAGGIYFVFMDQPV